jgi:hypothetical protein
LAGSPLTCHFVKIFENEYFDEMSARGFHVMLAANTADDEFAAST